MSKREAALASTRHRKTVRVAWTHKCIFEECPPTIRYFSLEASKLPSYSGCHKSSVLSGAKGLCSGWAGLRNPIVVWFRAAQFHAQVYGCTGRSLLIPVLDLTVVPGGSQQILRSDAAPVLFVVDSPGLGSATQIVDTEGSRGSRLPWQHSQILRPWRRQNAPVVHEI